MWIFAVLISLSAWTSPIVFIDDSFVTSTDTNLTASIVPPLNAQLQRLRNPTEAIYLRSDTPQLVNTILSIRPSHIIYHLVSLNEVRQAAMNAYAFHLGGATVSSSWAKIQLLLGGVALNGLLHWKSDGVEVMMRPFLNRLKILKSTSESLHVPFTVLWLGMPMMESDQPVLPANLWERFVFFLLAPLQTDFVVSRREFAHSVRRENIGFMKTGEYAKTYLLGPGLHEYISDAYSDQALGIIAYDYRNRIVRMLRREE